jgi:hypothetical protein
MADRQESSLFRGVEGCGIDGEAALGLRPAVADHALGLDQLAQVLLPLHQLPVALQHFQGLICLNIRIVCKTAIGKRRTCLPAEQACAAAVQACL